MEEAVAVRLQDDFDTAYNSEWKTANPIPDKYPRYTNFTTLSENLEQLMIEICKTRKSELLSNIF